MVYEIYCIFEFTHLNSLLFSLSCFEHLLYKNEKVIPKVFWVFNFGHFFCPFFKIPKRSWRNVNFVTEMQN
jgi:hypothetical protein